VGESTAMRGSLEDIKGNEGKRGDCCLCWVVLTRRKPGEEERRGGGGGGGE